jgi:hypothetical protein
LTEIDLTMDRHPHPGPASSPRRASLVLFALFSGLIPAVAPSTGSAAERPALRYGIPADFRPDVESLFAAARRRDLDTLAMQLDRLIDLRENRNIPNLSAVAGGLLPYLQVAVSGVPEDRGVALFRKTVRLAPDLPEVHFALARVHLAGGLGGLGPAVRSFTDGVVAWTGHPPAVFRTAANAAYYLFWAWILATLLTALLMLVRYWPEMVHDIGDLFPASVHDAFSAKDVVRSRRTRFQIGRGLGHVLALSLTVLLLALPLFAGIGLLGGVLLWTLVILRYARRAEIVTSFLLIATVGALPFVGAMVLLPRQFDTAPGPATYECLATFCPERSVASIHRRAEESPSDPVLRHALALHEIQSSPGSLPAIALALERLAPASGDWTGGIQTFQGNLYLTRAIESCPDGRPEPKSLAQARAAYDAALDRWPSSPYALRGLSLVQGLQGDRAGREETLARLVNAVTDGDLDFVAHLRTLSSAAAPCAGVLEITAELRLPDPRTWDVFLEGVDLFALPASLPFGGPLEGRIPVAGIPWLALACLLLGGVIVWSRDRMNPAGTCPRCGTVSCGHCNVRSSGFDYCPICLFDQVKPAFVDPLDLVARQRRRDEQSARRRTLLPILALAIPGSGQILSGRPVRGCTMILLLALVIALLASPEAPFIDIQAYRGAVSGTLPPLPPVLLVLVYAWSALDVWMTRNR